MRGATTNATKLPEGLVQEIARAGASFAAWRAARTNNDFNAFAPYLGKVTLQREVADRYGFKEARYDALLDIYEPGMTASRLDTLFKRVREISVAVLQRIQRSGHTVDTSCLSGDFPADRQVALCEQCCATWATTSAVAVSNSRRIPSPPALAPPSTCA